MPAPSWTARKISSTNVLVQSVGPVHRMLADRGYMNAEVIVEVR